MHKSRGFFVTAIWFSLCSCGGVSTNESDGGVGDDARAIDAAALDAPIDADSCPDFATAPGGLSFHAALCGTALGFNPNADPTTMTLACPVANPNPGTYGAILQPPAAIQADGCAATTPTSRLISTPVETALVQVSTTETLTLSDGDRLRVRLSCADTTACEGDVQITISAPGRPTVLAFPEGGGQAMVSGPAVVDVDVPIPAAALGANNRVNFIVFSRASGTADILFENPHISP